VDEGADAGSVLNAADEVAVEAFLKGEIRFPDIARINRLVLDRRPGLCGSAANLLRSDGLARDFARQEVQELGARARARA
jgi:1-deoxy-D-xylulose-5-phosphate reductoisomerase